MIQVLREQHSCPQYIAEAVTSIVGRNRFGEPWARWVWGWNRLDWVGGKFEDRDEHGELIRQVITVRREPKYFWPALNPSRWYFEVWCPPELYGSPEAWYQDTKERDDDGKLVMSGTAAVDALGPYPVEGNYEHSFTLEDAAAGFVQLDLEIARYVAHLWRVQRSRAVPTKTEQRSAFQDAKDRDYHSFADSVLNDGPAFGARPFVTVPNKEQTAICPT